MKTSFYELNLSQEILRAIEDLGFTTPTEIQTKAISSLLETKRDMIALAQTGTGKTAAFGLPLIEGINQTLKVPQALILCPTRELCMQLTNELERFCKYLNKISIVAIYGGANIDSQLKKLKQGVHIVVATPGRMKDIINRRKIDLSEVSTLVLDEADEMLNMGFQDDLDLILSKTPKEKNTLLFSATMPPEVAKIAKKYMRNYFEITAGKKNVGTKNVEHEFYLIKERDRYLALKRIADINPNIYGIVFCRTRAETKEVSNKLMQDGYNADALHGDLSQAQRDQVMTKFRNKNLHMLVATDVAARGLDVDDLTHIVNYNIPEESEIYLHRSGRTGRAGKTGISIAIINNNEKTNLKRIERIINKKFIQKQIPTVKDIYEAQLYSLIDRMKNVEIDKNRVEPFMEAVNSKLKNFSKDDIIKSFVSLEFNRFIDYYKDAKDLNIGVDDIIKPTKKRTSGRRGFDRMFINLGKKDKIGPRDLLDLVKNNTQNSRIKIGDISLKDSFTFFDVEKEGANLIISSLSGVNFLKRKIRVEIASNKESNNRKRKRYSH